MSTESKISLGIADDHQLFRKGMTALLNEMEGFDIVLEAENGKHLLERLQYVQPQVLLLDLDMPEMGGAEALPIIREKFPELKVLILTMHDEDLMILKVMELGANGYLLKGSDPDELEKAIQTVVRSDYFLSEKVSRVMLQKVVGPKHFGTELLSAEALSRREMEVLQLVCQEHTNADIADKLSISPRTVEGHRQRIIAKIGAKNTIGMVIYAIKEGLVDV